MTAVLTSVLEVFSAIGDWIVTAIQDITPAFYATEGGLTFLGVLAACGLGVSIILLIFNIIKDFLHFR